MAGDSKAFGKVAKKKQNMEMYDALESTISRVTEQAQRFRRKMKELSRRVENLESDANMPAGRGGMQEQEAGWQMTTPRASSPTDFSPPSVSAIRRYRETTPKVVINVGGLRHEVMWRMLARRPLTRLGRLARARTHDDILELADAYSLKDNEFYFDRDPANFNCVLNFYRTEKLHMTDEMCVLSYADDLKFWMIHEINMHICCVDKFHARRDTIMTNIEKENATLGGEEGPEEDFGDGYFANYQKALWDLFENPQSSIAAKILSLISIGLVLASLVGMCLNTFTWLQIEDINGKPQDNPKLAMVEAICIAYFTVEFLLRWAGAPKKWAFLKSVLNIVDVAAIAPYYLTLFFVPSPDFGPRDPTALITTTMEPLMAEQGEMAAVEEEEEEGGFGNVGRVMQVFRIARIMRIFKLARRSVGLQSMAHTVKTSWKDLGLLFMLVGMGQLVFGSLLYYIESGEEDTGFTSIPQGMWWAVQTLTSLGYGDFPVQTILGKLVGSFTAVCGVLVMALPIPIVVDNFADYYSEQKKLEAKELKEEEMAKEAVVILAAAQLAEDSLVDTVCRPDTFTEIPPETLQQNSHSQ